MVLADGRVNRLTMKQALSVPQKLTLRPTARWVLADGGVNRLTIKQALTRKRDRLAESRICPVRQARFILLREKVSEFLGKGGFKGGKTFPCKERFSPFGRPAGVTEKETPATIRIRKRGQGWVGETVICYMPYCHMPRRAACFARNAPRACDICCYCSYQRKQYTIES